MEPEKANHVPDCNNLQNMIVLKIFDQCKIQECQELGPVISRENCEYKILSPCDEDASLARTILPGCPIPAPQFTACIKAVKDSFCLTGAEIVNVCPSPMKRGYWNADIVFYFDFALQLFDANMRPLKIVCCPTTTDEIGKKKDGKFWIEAGICLKKQVLLYGGEKPSAQVFSNLLCNGHGSKDPYFLIQAIAYPGKVKLIDPSCTGDNPDSFALNVRPICLPSCDCRDPSHSPYCEPYFFIYIEICLGGIVKLIRPVCREVQSKPCQKPAERISCSEDPYQLFSEMEFPNEQFFPEKRKE